MRKITHVTHVPHVPHVSHVSRVPFAVCLRTRSLRLQYHMMKMVNEKMPEGFFNLSALQIFILNLLSTNTVVCI